jgi:hypothetical protein
MFEEFLARDPLATPIFAVLRFMPEKAGRCRAPPLDNSSQKLVALASYRQGRATGWQRLCRLDPRQQLHKPYLCILGLRRAQHLEHGG